MIWKEYEIPDKIKLQVNHRSARMIGQELISQNLVSAFCKESNPWSHGPLRWAIRQFRVKRTASEMLLKRRTKE